MATYDSPSYVDSDTFTVAGDYTSGEGGFDEGRALKMDCGVDGVKYGHVLSASYSDPNTTVNLTSGSDAITSNLEEVITSPVRPGDAGNLPLHDHSDEGKGGGGVIPSGVIVMWSGTLVNIPSGWSLCDGTGGTPDLRERFIMGARVGENPGTTGGASSQTLTEAQLPSHNHGDGSLATGSDGAHTHDIVTDGSGDNANRFDASGWGGTQDRSDHIVSAGAHTHSISGSTGSTGSGSSFDNRPAYYELAFIMKD